MKSEYTYFQYLLFKVHRVELGESSLLDMVLDNILKFNITQSIFRHGK